MERTTNGLPPIHPGEYVCEALEDLGLSQAELARPPGRFANARLASGARRTPRDG
jgi:plasmid maintenance system antidote protein VapI